MGVITFLKTYLRREHLFFALSPSLMDVGFVLELLGQMVQTFQSKRE